MMKITTCVFVLMVLVTACDDSPASIRLIPADDDPPIVTPPDNPDDVPTTKRDKTLSWNDEFTTSFDANKWSIQLGDGSQYGIPGWGNNEEQYYQASNVEVKDGNLVITAKKQQLGGKQYTSARIRSQGKGDFLYGYIEARIKLPEAQQGIWPAFWMLPTGASKAWPESGEIDIMEWIGREPTKIHGTIHYGDPAHQQATNHKEQLSGYASSWHVYAIEWTAESIKWYLDDVEYAVVSKSQTTAWPFSGRQFHLLINLAVGGNWPGATNASTTLPQTLEVDYVRVYQ